MKLQLILAPNAILNTKTQPVAVFDKELKEEVAEMLRIMKEEKGVGLAANQVGLNKSMFVLDIPNLGALDGKIVKAYVRRTMINPTLELSGADVSISEGCLSFPNKLVKVPRKFICNISYQNIFGETVKEELTGLAAIVAQHEYDHLLGKTFLDVEQNV